MPREFDNLLSSKLKAMLKINFQVVDSYFVEFTKFNLVAINYNFAMDYFLATYFNKLFMFKMLNYFVRSRVFIELKNN